MNETEMRRAVREEVQKQLNVVLFGASADSDGQTETINDLFPDMPGITKRPIVHPFGFVSRASKGVISVVVRVGAHFGNRMVIGHRDAGRPSDLSEGESALYNASGQRVYLKKGKILVGSSSAAEPLVLGNVMLDALTEALAEIKTLSSTLRQIPAGLTTAPGNPIAPNPAFVAALTDLETAIAQAKSTYISTAESNIVSQEVFSERSGS